MGNTSITRRFTCKYYIHASVYDQHVDCRFHGLGISFFTLVSMVGISF